MLNLILPILLFFGTPETEATPVKFTKVTIDMKDKDGKMKEVFNSVYPSDISKVKSLLSGKSTGNAKTMISVVCDIRGLVVVSYL